MDVVEEAKMEADDCCDEELTLGEDIGTFIFDSGCPRWNGNPRAVGSPHTTRQQRSFSKPRVKTQQASITIKHRGLFANINSSNHLL